LLNKLTGLFHGWHMIGASCAIRLLGGGLHAYGFTIFFLPVTQELGSTRAATSLVFSLARAESAIQGLLAAYYIDRFGPRPVTAFPSTTFKKFKPFKTIFELLDGLNVLNYLNLRQLCPLWLGLLRHSYPMALTMGVAAACLAGP
jgi:hypothetical protein